MVKGSPEEALMQKLLALVDGADEAKCGSLEEARSKAMVACAFVREHRKRIVFVEPGKRAPAVRRNLPDSLAKHGVTSEEIPYYEKSLCRACGRVLKGGGLFSRDDSPRMLCYKPPPTLERFARAGGLPKSVLTHDTDECREWWGTYKFDD